MNTVHFSSVYYDKSFANRKMIENVINESDKQSQQKTLFQKKSGSVGKPPYINGVASIQDAHLIGYDFYIENPAENASSFLLTAIPNNKAQASLKTHRTLVAFDKTKKASREPALNDAFNSIIADLKPKDTKTMAMAQAGDTFKTEGLSEANRPETLTLTKTNVKDLQLQQGTHIFSMKERRQYLSTIEKSLRGLPKELEKDIKSLKSNNEGRIKALKAQIEAIKKGEGKEIDVLEEAFQQRKKTLRANEFPLLNLGFQVDALLNKD